MPIPTEGKKAIYTSDKIIDSGKLVLKKGDKGIVTIHTYHIIGEYAFYPLKWNGYCTTVLNIDFEFIK
jgi:hypothetical protein